MSLKLVLVAPVVLLASLAGCKRGVSHDASDANPAGVVVLRISTDGEFLAYDPTELKCPAGARVRLIFHHAGQRIPQEHNWVLVVPGSRDAVAQESINAGEAQGYLARNDSRILAATPMCGPGADAVVEFTAPPPGVYPFICTFPGHAAEMTGTLCTFAP